VTLFSELQRSGLSRDVERSPALPLCGAGARNSSLAVRFSLLVFAKMRLHSVSRLHLCHQLEHICFGDDTYQFRPFQHR
jgi:hypothetical protein